MPKNERLPEKKPTRPQNRSKKPNVKKVIPAWAWTLVGAGLAVVVLVVTYGAYSVLGRGEKEQQLAAIPTRVGSNDPKNPSSTPSGPSIDEQPAPRTPRPNPTPQPTEPVTSTADIDKDWPTLPPKKRTSGSSETPVRTKVRWYADPATQRPLVVLEIPTEPFPFTGYLTRVHRGLLARELARQAILYTAREEFGAATRDLAMRETLPPAAIDANLKATWTLSWHIYPGKHVRLSLTAADGHAVWELNNPISEGPFDYSEIASVLETAARGPLADAMAKEIKAERMAPMKSNAAVSAKTLAKLDAANFFELDAAVREIHAARRIGESPANTVALVRAYAILGLLTEHLDIVSHKSYKARALLYAQRGVAAGAAESKWALAYATCLAGMHATAEKLAGDAAVQPPKWAAVIRPTVEFDADALKKITDAGAVAEVLRFAVVYNVFKTGPGTTLGIELIQRHSDCFRVADSLAQYSGLGAKRLVTESSFALLTASIGERLTGMPGLPGAALVKKAANNDVDAEVEFLRALDRDAGQAEPSYSSLAALIREQRANHTTRLVYVLEKSLGLPREVPKLLIEVMPYLVDHPRKTLFEAKVEANAAQLAIKAAKEFPASEMQMLGWADDDSLFASDRSFASQLWTTRSIHADDVVMDKQSYLIRLQPSEHVTYSRACLQISTHMPIPHALLIRSDWEKCKAEAPAWEKKFRNHPVVISELAARYDLEGSTDDAIRLWQRAIELSPDNSSYLALARIYSQVKKDESKALELMKERLEKPDAGLEHAQMRVAIANKYGEKKNYETALEYAEEAAQQSGAEWAMVAAIKYANFTGDKIKAAKWEAQRAARYGNR
jgi:tetratricopeptide (TPR) repeat protein